MFIPGITAHRQFNPPANWNIENMCYDVDYFYVGTQEVDLRSVIVRPDGTQFFIAGENLTIYSYTMSIAWDLSTAIYDNKSFNLGERAYTLLFNPTGTRLIYSINGELIYQRDLSVAWDITTLGSATTYDPAEEVGSTRCGMFIDTSGTKMYWGSRLNDTFYQYTLLTPWDISTAVYDNKSYNYSVYGTTMDAIWFNGDGSKWLLTNDTAVLQFSCSTNWDISTSLYDSVALEYGTGVGADGVGSMRYQSQFANNGTYLYSGARVGDYVFRYRIDCDCPTIADLRYNESISVTAQEDVPRSVSFNLLGTKMFIGGDTNNTIFQYTLSIPWDVSSATYDTVSLVVEDSVDSIVFDSAGTKMTYACDDENVYQRTLSIGYDLSTAGSSTFFDSPDLTTEMGGHDISPDGTKLYIVNRTNYNIYQYTLETPWDVTTAIAHSVDDIQQGQLIKLTFDNSASNSDLNDFPLLVRINSTDVPDLNLSTTIGADIRFYDDDYTKLKYEVEDWNSATNDATIWVKIPKINASSINDFIYMYYNFSEPSYDQSIVDEQDVWALYEGVYHLNENPNATGTFFDSTSNNYDGTNASTTNVAGIISDGQDFSGAGQYIHLGNNRDFASGVSETTLSGWFQFDSISTIHQLISISVNNGGNPTNASRIAIGQNESGNLAVLVKGADDGSDTQFPITTTAPISIETWHYIAVSINLVTDTLDVYVDGVYQAIDITPVWTNTTFDNTPSASNAIGSEDDGSSGYLNGQVDEVRIENIARSSDWIEASYLNQKDSSTFISFGTPTEVPNWLNSNWLNRRKLTFDNSSQIINDLDNFPLLVRLNNTNFPNLNLSAIVGADIRFTEAITGIELKYEVEGWDDITNIATIWVKVPRINAGSTNNYINIYYNYDGTPTYDQSVSDEQAVWDTNYSGVWHMDGTLDSTSNGNDSTLDETSDIVGQIDQGREWGDDDRLSMGSGASLDNLTTFTFSTWIYQTDTPVSASRFFEKRTASGESINLYINDFNRIDFIRKTTGDQLTADTGSFTMLNDTWYQVTITTDGTLNLSGVNIYIDGVALTAGGSSGSGSLLDDAGGDLWIGSRNTGDRTLRGTMDEVRMSNVVRSADWVGAEYLNQKDNSTFISYGIEEIVGWDLPNWNKRVRVTIDNSNQTTNDLDNFPLLVRLNPTDYPGLDLSTTFGADIRFVNSDGTELKYEVEGWDNITNIATVWVKIPKIVASSSTNYIYVYFNNDSATYDQSVADEQAVWNNDYVGVYHLGEESVGTGTPDVYKDSTVNVNHGDDEVSSTGKDGQVGKGQEFNGVDDYIDVSDVGNNIDGDWGTVSGWVRINSSGTTSNMFHAQATLNDLISLAWLFDDSGFLLKMKRGGVVSSILIPAGALIDEDDGINHFVAMTWDKIEDELKVFIGGNQYGTQTGLGNWSGIITDVSIGYNVASGIGFLPGMIDEVNVSTVARSANWIRASYLNQKDNSTYTRVGLVESNSKSLDVSAETLLPGGISWCASGKRFFITNGLTDILQYSATENWDISTGIFDRLYNPATNGNGDGNSGNRRQTYWYQDGNEVRLFFTNESTDFVYGYTAHQWGLSGDY